VDDWNAYHLLWGEVHCGTNTVRTPTANWWEDAMHLLEEGE
jgi:protein-arginine deiminase